MGYDYCITRDGSWAEAADDSIDVAEWLAAVAQLPVLQPVATVQVGATALKLPPDSHAHRWTGHPERPDGGPIFELRKGKLDYRGGDTASMHFALRLAALLGARVVGEEDEEYTLSSLLGPEDESGWETKNPFTKEPIFRKWEGVVEQHGDEWHLVVTKTALFGLRHTQERALLYPIVELPDDIAGRKICLRGTISDPGTYGKEASCKFVFYVLKVVGG